MGAIQKTIDFARGYVSARGIFAALIVFLLLRTLQVRYRAGLRRIPGPFWASISAIDRIRSAASGSQYNDHLHYHERYGALVRVGPNHVSIGDAKYIQQLYGITSKFTKSKFYTAFDVMTPHGTIPTIFSIRDPAGHNALKRPIAHTFAMSSLLDLEPMADDCTRIFQEKLDKMQGTPFDLGTWLQWYAFDVISSITFSSRFDFMKNEHDVAGIIEAIEGRLLYNSVVGQVPLLHEWLLGSQAFATYAAIIPAIRRLGSGRYIAQFARTQMDRYLSLDQSKNQFRDMLAQFKTTRDGQPTALTDDEVHSHVTSNIFAGSDTTAISLRSVFYYLCKNPRCMNEVLSELNGADTRGELSELVTFSEGSRLKYFQACLKEALRMHPAVGFLLERLVPEGGADFDGVHLPAGTVVGINPWVLAYDKNTYGADADIYRPERWLEASKEAYKMMDRSYFAFGAGARTCLGKNVSLMEMSKLVPQLLRGFTFELADPEAVWELHDYWFVKQTNLVFNVRRRAKH